MYAGVPSENPVCVMRSLPASRIARAIPKSSTIACPERAMSTFSGFTSRWMMPHECEYESASAIWLVMRSASAIGKGLSRVSRSRSVSPSIAGMT